jgi:hypothetical protein
MFGVAANCTICKVLASQVFFNAKKERICADCIQKEHDAICTSLEEVSGILGEVQKKNKGLELKITEYDTILEQIKNFTNLVKRE